MAETPHFHPNRASAVAPPRRAPRGKEPGRPRGLPLAARTGARRSGGAENHAETFRALSTTEGCGSAWSSIVLDTCKGRVHSPMIACTFFLFFHIFGEQLFVVVGKQYGPLLLGTQNNSTAHVSREAWGSVIGMIQLPILAFSRLGVPSKKDPFGFTAPFCPHLR